MSARLIAEEGLLKELVLNLSEGDHWTIGRDPDACELLVEDPSASRQHARCRLTEAGIVLENLSTTNPTLVNDQPITEPKLLHHGDAVRIGDTLFRYYRDDSVRVFEEDQDNQEEDPPIANVTDTEEDEEEMIDDTVFSREKLVNEPKLAEINFDLLDTGKWLLKVISGPNNGAEFSMQAGTTYTLGTDPNACDIIFQDNSVSRQHARLVVSDDETLTLEDLRSRNGTIIDGEKIEGKVQLKPNAYVVVGTTSFVVYDREGEMQTIISPLLPSIVKVLKGEEKKEAPPVVPAGPTEAELAAEREKKEAAAREVEAAAHAVRQSKVAHLTRVGIFAAVLLGIFAVVGIGISSLFQSEPVVVENPIDPDQALTETMAVFPGVKYTFNRTTGRLLLVGHVLTANDKNQLIYGLQGLNFLSDIDDTGVVIDEYVWNEINQNILRNPDWRGVTVQAPTPGHFVLTGYLKTRDQAQDVWDYMSRNFPYLDLLENKVVVEQDLLTLVNNALINKGLPAVKAQLSNGELILTGDTTAAKLEVLNTLIDQFKELHGIRSVKNLVSQVGPEEAVRNITDQYTVGGVSVQDGQTSLYLNNRIVKEGDVIDKKKITQIKPHVIMLEDTHGVLYRIDY